MAIAVVNQGTIFSITDRKLYVPVVTLSTQNNAKLLEKLKFGFKRTINCNRYQSKVSTEIPNQYLDNWYKFYWFKLIDASFQAVIRLFVLSFEDGARRRRYKLYFILTVKIKDYNVMIDEKKISINQLKKFKDIW